MTRKQVAEAVQRPDILFKDAESSSLVAVRKTNHRYPVVIYVPREEANRVVTVYHASDVDRLIRRKLGRGVWTKE
ncbi:MAG: hypothetical protein JRN54_00110 [Nitrososphaerota archaeon]|nr:hypothetical protein [Nitrososphaerota archaeon]MDG6975918.1 hypothetical protein [Nitrososphaerota archaeon]